MDSTVDYAELRRRVDEEYHERLTELQTQQNEDYQKSLEDQLENSGVFGQDLLGLYQDWNDAWANLQRGNVDAAINSFGDIFDNWEDLLKRMVAQWAISGIAGLLSGQGFSGFNTDALLGQFAGLLNTTQTNGQTPGINGNNGTLGTLVTALGGNNQTVQASANGLGGAGSIYSGYNQIDAGLEQGGTGGALNVVAGASSIYGGVKQVMSAYNTLVELTAAGDVATALQGAERTIQVIDGLNTATQASNTVSQTAVASEQIASTTAPAVESAGATSSTSAALGATAAWIAVGVLADEYLNDGRVQNAFAIEAQGRYDGLKDLFDGEFDEFFKAQYKAPYEALKATFAARPFEQIIAEDYKPDLFGSQSATEAVGADGGVGFNGGNTAIFGANYGISGTGLLTQHLAAGGDNGTVAYLTGATAQLEEFKSLLEETGYEARIAGGILEAKLGEATEQQFLDLWQAYADGLEQSVAATDVAATVLTENIITANGLLLENISVVTGQSAFEVREMVTKMDGLFEIYKASGETNANAVYLAFAEASGLSLAQTEEFFRQSGESADAWAQQFIANTDVQIAAMLDFNEQGQTAFEGLATAAGGAFSDAAAYASGSLANMAADAAAYAASANNALGSITYYANNIGGNLAATQPAQGAPLQQFNTGTPRILNDGPAVVHKDEMIIDPNTSAALRKYGIEVSGGSSRALEQKVDAMTAATLENTKVTRQLLRHLQNNAGGRLVT